MSAEDFDQFVSRALEGPPTSYRRYDQLRQWLAQSLSAPVDDVHVTFISGGSKNFIRLDQDKISGAAKLGLVIVDDAKYTERVLNEEVKPRLKRGSMLGTIAIVAQVDGHWSVTNLVEPTGAVVAGQLTKMLALPDVPVEEVSVTGPVDQISPPGAGDSSGSQLGLQSLFEQVMEDLSGRVPRTPTSIGDAPQLSKWVEAEIPTILNSLVGDAREARGGIGQRYLAEVPWVGIFDSSGSVSAKSGYYLVYLFSADGATAYLSLNQGVENVEGGLAPIRKRALDLRRAAGSPNGYLHSIKLASQVDRPKKYEAGNALAIAYGRGAVPPDAKIIDDLKALLEILGVVEDSGLRFDPNHEPVHLLFKWKTALEPNAVGVHRQVAIDKGSVWWGRFGKPGSLGMGKERLAELRRQLAEGIETHVYLYRAGEVWRCKLEEVTNSADDVDADRLPNYYSTSDCNLFVRITGFAEMTVDWLSEHLVLTTSPDPAELKGALPTQTTPLFVYELFDDGALEGGGGINGAPTIEWLVEESGWSQARLESVIASLEDESPQVILQGPPGTGKTWVARLLARYLTKGEPLAYQIVQFHPSYGYEEFVEGLRPVVIDGKIDFRREDGVVLRMASEISESDQTRVLIIDEMNRANLPRVMGELMYLLEYRNEAIDLMYSAGFSLPPKLMIIGTMNTADRSIRSIDIAMRRRFDVFDCPPDLEVLKSYYASRTNEVGMVLFEGFEALNNDLLAERDRHHLIGHTFFMRDPMTEAALKRVWDLQVSPIIEEYFLDQPDIGAGFTFAKYFQSDAG